MVLATGEHLYSFVFLVSIDLEIAVLEGMTKFLYHTPHFKARVPLLLTDLLLISCMS